jgi:hypothetical protein
MPVMDGAPEISVLIVSAGDHDGLRVCLEIVREQAEPLGAELVLVINAPEESVDPPVRKDLDAVCDLLAFEPRVGKSHGLNTGVSRCRGAVVAFTDDDALPQPGWLEAITTPLLRPDRRPEHVGTGGPVVPTYPWGEGPGWYRKLAEARSTHFLGPAHDLGDEPVDYRVPPEGDTGAPLGVNCAYRRETLACYAYDPELGPNRETGLRGGEDFELAYRMMLDGYQLTYVPAARVEHPVNPARMTWRHVRQRFYLNGVEGARMLERLELSHPPLENLRKRVGRRRFRRHLRRLFDPVGYRVRMATILERQGMLEELVRLGVRSSGDG